MIEPFKYLLQPVAYERGDDGRVIREIAGEPLVVFNAEQAAQAIMMFEQNLAAQQNGGAVPVNQSTTLDIVCDNPDCPGNDLPTDDRNGWTFVTTEVYGQPGEQHVYCCADCAGTVSEALREAETAPAE